MRALAMVVYFPALLGWVVFAPAFRLANKVFPNGGAYSRWHWCGVGAEVTSRESADE